MTIFDNTTAFGLMDKALQDEMKAWGGGHLIYSSSGEWMPWGPSWSRTSIYRAIPVHLTKPSVDWTILSDKVAGIAQDSDGYICAYKKKPDAGRFAWLSGVRWWQLHPEFLTSVTPGTCDWRDSWVDNPRYKP